MNDDLQDQPDNGGTMSDTVHTHGGSDHLLHDGCPGCDTERDRPPLTTRHTVTVDLEIDWERVTYSPNLPDLAAEWTPRNVQDAITSGHALIVRDLPARHQPVGAGDRTCVPAHLAEGAPDGVDDGMA